MTEVCQICFKKATVNFIGYDYIKETPSYSYREPTLFPVPTYKIPMCAKCQKDTTRELGELRMRKND